MIFSSSSRDFFYTDSQTSALTYYLAVDGQPVYWGKAVSPNGIKINVGKRISDYLDTHMPDFREYDGVVVEHPRQLREFTLNDGEGNLLETYTVLLDFDGSWTGVYGPLSQPINSHADPRQKIFWTTMSETGGTFEIVGWAPLEVTLTGDFTIPAEGGTIEIGFVSNTGFTIDETCDWLTVTKSGETEGTLTIVAEENDGEERTCTITLVQEDVGSIEGSEYVFEVSQEEGVNYSEKYLTFDILSGGTLCFEYLSNPSSSMTSSVTMYYSIDEGNEWIGFTLSAGQNYILNVNARDRVLLNSTNNCFTDYTLNFESTAVYNVSGNILSLVYGDEFIGRTPSSMPDRWFNLFFGNTKVVSAKNLVLCPTLFTQCYDMLFINCTMLTEPPKLNFMQLADWCYLEMFKNCPSLTKAPNLPATTLKRGCYTRMFEGCTSLTEAPELPATALTISCYYEMFRGCTSLTKSPVLVGDTLVNNCYKGMFYQCSLLSEVTFLARSFRPVEGTEGWLKQVAANGVFKKKSSASSWLSGGDGIPVGWTIINVDAV